MIIRRHLDYREESACEFMGGHRRCVPTGGGPLHLTTFQGTQVYTSNHGLLGELRVQVILKVRPQRALLTLICANELN